MKKHLIKISVRNLVEFILKKGDYRSVFVSSQRALQGTKGHQFVQKQRPENYSAEQAFKYLHEIEDIRIEISGRIDGIFANETPIIDEIKTTNTDLKYISEDYNPLHWAQAKSYAYIYSLENNLPKVIVRLTYLHLESKNIKEIDKEFSLEELKVFFNNLIKKYYKWAAKIYNWYKIRDESIKTLNFPFQNWRKGQRKMGVAVYHSVKNKKNIFICAPTGIGKTMAAIFPTLKSFEEQGLDKIFYLTAKTIGRTVAVNTIKILKSKGLRFKSIVLTAKEKICFKPESACVPEECEYCIDYYENVKKAVSDIFSEDIFTREIIIEYAQKFQVCPFEFSLDLSLWCDIVICDYNYAFDPKVYLRRFFETDNSSYTFLIDEAHNLPDRARSMFSAQIEKQSILEIRREIKEELPNLAKQLYKINKLLLEKRKEAGLTKKKIVLEEKKPKDILKALRSFTKTAEKWLAKNIKTNFRKNLLELYFDFIAYLKIADNFSENYTSYFEKKGNNLKAKLFCKDPSPLLREGLERAKANIFFSASLIPLDYYENLIIGNTESLKIQLPSPFPKENFSLLINKKISTYYKDREKSYKPICTLLKKFIDKKTANYLVFFPSYKYMESVLESCDFDKNIYNIHSQKRNMDENEREDFLSKFKIDPQKINIGFVVMGGIFGEGIDLAGSKLYAAIIIGVALPKLNIERDLIKEFYDKHNKNGFEYAYSLPGFNKVLQAAGRVIRTSDDKGKVLLVDIRFGYRRYLNYFPDFWQHFKFVNY